MKNPTCSTCRWQNDGHCFHMPPAVHLLMAQTIQGTQPQPVSVHPPVRPNNFCSKHETGAEVDVIDVTAFP